MALQNFTVEATSEKIYMIDFIQSFFNRIFVIVHAEIVIGFITIYSRFLFLGCLRNLCDTRGYNAFQKRDFYGQENPECYVTSIVGAFQFVT